MCILKMWRNYRLSKIFRDIDRQIESDPSCLIKPSREQLEEIEKLIEGVEID